MRLGISEILGNASKISKKQDKLDYLRNNFNPVLGQILKYTYEPQFEWELPPGEPPYKPSEFPDSQSMLYQEARKLYMFVENGHPELQKPHNKLKREQLFINLLESLDKDDAELIVSVKDKKLPYKRITKKFVDKVFPGLIDG